jgi:hypothetical protein
MFANGSTAMELRADDAVAEEAAVVAPEAVADSSRGVAEDGGTATVLTSATNR